jgi:ankyrin repeat protein
MEVFEYEPLNLETCSFRLVRIFKGHYTAPIQCELFQVGLYNAEDILEFEALSYTWGGTDKWYGIEVNKRNFQVTENLFLALQHLRYQHEDRILWIDAICINQENLPERGHQVRQMSSIYKEAEQVIIWLGQATPDTNLVYHDMQSLEKQAVHHACSDWRSSDERWQLLWSNVGIQRSNLDRHAQQEGLKNLLCRSWFKRVWILQEVANARSAKVMCGAESVSARIFAVAPALLGITPGSHCQAVLDIMPGPSRKYSWWAGKRDLRTLLLKFRQSEASDSRDIIYALLGMSSNGCGTAALVPDYEKSLSNVIQDAIAFLLHIYDWESSVAVLPRWTLCIFFCKLVSLENAVLRWAAANGHEGVLKLLLETGKVHVDQRYFPGYTPLLLAASKGYETVVKLLLETSKVDINFKDKHGRTPLWWAASNGHEAVVHLLLETGKVDIDLKDQDGQTPLLWAAKRGKKAVVKLLLETSKVNVDVRDQRCRTPLWLAASNGHEAVVKLLLDIGKADVEVRNLSGQTLLLWAAMNRDELLVRMLLEISKVNVNSEDQDGRTPLSWAASDGHEALAKLLLETGKINVDSKDKYQRTPLFWAASKGHKALVKLLLEVGKCDVKVKDQHGRTPVWWATSNGHEAVAKLLLKTSKIQVDSEDYDG